VANNPVFTAFSEAHRVRPGAKFIVSLGTGEVKEAKKYSLSAPTCNKPLDIPAYDEHTHQKFAAFVRAQSDQMGAIKYERFNPTSCDLPLDTADVKQFERMKAETKEYMRRSDTKARMQAVVDACMNREQVYIPPTMNMNVMLEGKRQPSIASTTPPVVRQASFTQQQSSSTPPVVRQPSFSQQQSSTPPVVRQSSFSQQQGATPPSVVRQPSFSQQQQASTSTNSTPVRASQSTPVRQSSLSQLQGVRNVSVASNNSSVSDKDNSSSVGPQSPSAGSSAIPDAPPM
jgi:hypothetical protein